jgi:hypothetical protein
LWFSFLGPKDQKETAHIFRQLMRADFHVECIPGFSWGVDEETLTALESEAQK